MVSDEIKRSILCSDVQSVSNTQKQKFRVLTRPSRVQPITFVLVKRMLNHRPVMFV